MNDIDLISLAVQLAKRGHGKTSPNPMVGAILVKGGKIIGQGWHRRAGLPHAEIEALNDAQKRGCNPKGATLYVTLEPCCTYGRTPPCTVAIIAAGIKRVVVGTSDPNPKHAGKGFQILKRAGIEIVNFSEVGIRTQLPCQRIADQCKRLNEAFNHWIVQHTPFVTVKAAMTLDGKIATASGESKWITGKRARIYGMKLRRGADAVLVGINTILADDSSLTIRAGANQKSKILGSPRRIILDSMARTPLSAKIVTDAFRDQTLIVVTKSAPKSRVKALASRVKVLMAPILKLPDKNLPAQIDLHWLMKKLGGENLTSLLVEGGGEVNASFLLGGMAHRVTFFYAPKILGGRAARKGVAGAGIQRIADMVRLQDVEWQRLGQDLRLTARLK